MQNAAVHTDLVIIGAGLTGLALAYFLKDEGVDFHILEARPRPGGRILTRYEPNGAPVEMGATWFGRKHREVMRLLQMLKLDYFEQYTDRQAIFQQGPDAAPQLIPIPQGQEPSYRIAGGTMSIIETLLKHVAPDRLHLGEKVHALSQVEGGLLVESTGTRLHTRVAVSTLPPRLLVSSVAFSPDLPQSLKTLAHNTHTWMGESIKVGLRYRKPFWRGANASGTIFSHLGPIIEMYDHSDDSAGRYALKGFLNPGLHALSKEDRKALVIRQLQGYYGPQAKQYLSYEEVVWRDEACTRLPEAKDLAPHQNNGDPVFRQSFLDGTLFMAGSETASEYPGYMDGAVRSARKAFETLSQNFSFSSLSQSPQKAPTSPSSPTFQDSSKEEK